MMADVMEKFGSYVVFAALLASCGEGRLGRTMGSRLVAVPIAGLVLAVIIESVQMFLPVRVTSLTDLILAAGGCMVGILSQHHLKGFYRLATVGIGQRAPGVPRAVGMGPTDELIGTLIDPHEGAPVESVPQPAKSPAHRGRRHSP